MTSHPLVNDTTRTELILALDVFPINNVALVNKKKKTIVNGI